MAIDNTTAIVTDTKSGTGWTIDVTNCNLDADLTLKDFLVEFDDVGQNNANFTKLSRTSLQYTGTSIGSTTVGVFRRTPITRIQEVVYASRITSGLWENEFNRLHKILNDSQAASFVDTLTLSASPDFTDDSLNAATTAWVRDVVAAFDEAADFQLTLNSTGDFSVNTNKFKCFHCAVWIDMHHRHIIIEFTILRINQ